jgi:hypothetical protein
MYEILQRFEQYIDIKRNSTEDHNSKNIIS